MLSELRRGLQVIFVERHYPVVALASSHPRNSVHNLFAGQAGRHRGQVFEHIPRPVGVAEPLQGQKVGPYPHPGALAQKFLAFLFTGYAENSLD